MRLLLSLVCLSLVGCSTITVNNTAIGGFISCSPTLDKPVNVDTLRAAQATVPLK